MDDKIFRKTSVERLSSPENLDRVMRVVPVKKWAALACLFAVAAAFTAWAFFGELSRQVKGPGVLLLPAGPGAPQTVIAVLSAEDGRTVKVGMAAFVILDAGDGAAVSGQVAGIAASDGQTLAVGGESVSASSLTDWTPGVGNVAVLIKLDADGAAKALESLAAADAVDASMIWPCRAEILIEQFHPVKLFVPG